MPCKSFHASAYSERHLKVLFTASTDSAYQIRAPRFRLNTALPRRTVVMRPCLMPNFSLITFTSGARPFVVHDAHETTSAMG